MQRMSLLALWRREFSHYSAGKFRQDLLAGLTVAAVALPLALAFGVASGATAPAGLVTAILGGLIIGALSGAPYQISGPTGAMSAVLIVIAQRFGIEGVWITGLLAGILILVIGLLRMGRFVAFIPSSVITGFTSGIAFIIFVGQIDNLLGIQTPGADSAALKFLSYFGGGWAPQWTTVAIGVLVIAVMAFWPRSWARYVPGSLAGIVLATLAVVVTGWPVANIGEIPRTILLDQRLTWAAIPWNNMGDLVVPALSIAALGAVESLLCGAVGSKMTGIRLQANQELVAQGIGNIIIPFFGGVPATAAIARSSVAIKSGGQTRLVSIIHALALLASALLLAPVISLIPMSALAGVLMVTAVRMNEWHAIRFMFGKRFKTGIVTFLVTFLATITLDLTQAIIIGGILSAGIFINQVANLEVELRTVDVERMRLRGIDIKTDAKNIRVAYLTGPLFFAATNTFNEAFAHEEDVDFLILSMRAVPLIDLSGIEALTGLAETLHAQGKTLMLAGVNPKVMYMLQRAGADLLVGKDNFFWSADRAILIAEQRHLHLTHVEIESEYEVSGRPAMTAMPL
jgi:sulfate permease, SulP family